MMPKSLHIAVLLHWHWIYIIQYFGLEINWNFTSNKVFTSILNYQTCLEKVEWWTDFNCSTLFHLLHTKYKYYCSSFTLFKAVTGCGCSFLDRDLVFFRFSFTCAFLMRPVLNNKYEFMQFPTEIAVGRWYSSMKYTSQVLAACSLGTPGLILPLWLCTSQICPRRMALNLETCSSLCKRPSHHGVEQGGPLRPTVEVPGTLY